MPALITGTSQKRSGRLQFRPAYVFLLFLAILLWYNLKLSHAPKETSWKEVAAVMLPVHAIDRIVVLNDEEAQIYIKAAFADLPPFREVMKPRGEKEALQGPHYQFAIGSVESFERKLDEAQKGQAASDMINVVYEKKGGLVWEVVGWLLPLALFMFVWSYWLRRSGQAGEASLFNFGRSGAKLVNAETQSKVTFNDVAGLDEAKTEVQEIVRFLKSPTLFTKLGAKIPKGIILVGPPGTGKTLLAKAVAGEAQVPFFTISGSAFVEMFVGVGASRVRDLFRMAKEQAPSIVFIDEIDAIGRSRGRNAAYTGSNDERESTLNQLLTEMDGFENNSGVIVLSATNRGDMLDPALLRAGRFDRHIYLELPNMKERQAIFHVHLSPVAVSPSVDAAALAAQSPGFSGADIANACNEAALIAARREKSVVEQEDFMEAIDRIVAGLEKKSKIISVHEKEIIAYHEAGHAVVSWIMPHVAPLSKVSIIPRGKSLGAAWYLPEERQLRSSMEFTEEICASLGGRAAEEVVFGEVTSGALDDLEKVTKQAYQMVAFYGFDKKVGVVSFYDSTGQADNGFMKPYSEETARLIDREVRERLATAYEETKEVLRQHINELGKMAKLLLQKEVVYKDEIETIMGARLTESRGNMTPAVLSIVRLVK